MRMLAAIAAATALGAAAAPVGAQPEGSPLRPAGGSRSPAGPNAQADRDYFAEPTEQAIKFRLDRPRTRKQRIVIASLLGAGAVFSGVGLAFHLDSREASNRVSAQDFTGQLYTEELDRSRRRALRSRAFAIVGYSLAGAAVAAGVAALIITQPGTDLLTGEGATPVSLIPVPGGAVAVKTWALR